jgi:hypothetical protein
MDDGFGDGVARGEGGYACYTLQTFTQTFASRLKEGFPIEGRYCGGGLNSLSVPMYLYACERYRLFLHFEGEVTGARTEQDALLYLFVADKCNLDGLFTRAKIAEGEISICICSHSKG